MDTDKVCIFASDKSFRIEIIKQLLADNEIKAFSINKRDSTYLFGEIELWVYRDDVIRAKRLINNFLT